MNEPAARPLGETHAGKPVFAIVGGGTAGWIAALMLQKVAENQKFDIEITVIESSRIPTIGVGEGTTSVFRMFLDLIDISDEEFLPATDATIKYGIRHQDWADIGITYDGPIDDPHQLVAEHHRPLSPWMNIHCIAKGIPVAESHMFHQLMRRGKAPYRLQGDRKPKPVSPYYHAYHFDQARVGAFLRSKAHGIRQVDAIVDNARINPETGDITELNLDNGQAISVDFVIDCTGFRRLLIGDVMNAEWQSYSTDLPVNRAMPFWLDHDPASQLPTYTLARALQCGWMWQIPTQSRMGCGYVYSDEFISPDEARHEVEMAIGCKIDPRADIKIDSGRLDRAWIGNCLALGLSQCFFEPLEATSIHGTIVQLILFLGTSLSECLDPPHDDRDMYNSIVGMQVDDFRTFINMHYVTRRRDSPFWIHVSDACVCDETRTLLDKWRIKPPTKDDFNEMCHEIPHVDDVLYYPVIDGLGLVSRDLMRKACRDSPVSRTRARKYVKQLGGQFRGWASAAAGHREYLQWLQN